MQVHSEATTLMPCVGALRLDSSLAIMERPSIPHFVPNSSVLQGRALMQFLQAPYHFISLSLSLSLSLNILMESSVADEKGEKNREMKIREPFLGTAPNPKGGLITIPFIIANEAFEKVASNGLLPNMIMYLMNEYHMDMATGSNLLFLWSAATNFTPVLGAYLADASVGRFPMIGFGSIVSLLGMVLLWLTTMIPQARPSPCNQSSATCMSPTTFQLTILCLSLGLMSIGAGGIRASSLAFGADQLLHNNPRNVGAMESYLSWYYAAASFSVVAALTCIVYIQENAGWKLGFGVPVLLMFLSALSFFLASPFYIKLKAKTSLLTGYAQVIVASYRNRHLALTSHGANSSYYHKKGSKLAIPSDNLRFLNKACIIRDPQQHDLITPDGIASDPWSLCTVDQVEELKTLIKVIPLWSTAIVMSMNINQTSFLVLQANSMDRRITPSFEFPAGSFAMFMIVAVTIWIPLYDRILLPLASRIMGKPAHLSAVHRMGIGLFLSFLSMVLTAIVENIRRNAAMEEGRSDEPRAVVRMSAFWLVPQNCLSGLAEAFSVVAQNEFYMSEFPRSMSSIASNLAGLGMSFAGLLASFLMTAIDDATKRGGKESWVSSNINRGHYDYYCWVLAGVSLVNLVYFLACSRAYGPCKENRSRVLDDGEEVGNE